MRRSAVIIPLRALRLPVLRLQHFAFDALFGDQAFLERRQFHVAQRNLVLVGDPPRLDHIQPGPVALDQPQDRPDGYGQHPKKG